MTTSIRPSEGCYVRSFVSICHFFPASNFNFLWFSMSWFKSKSLVRFDMPLGSARTRLHKVAETLLDQRNIYILTILYPSLVQPRLDSSVNYELLCINLQFDHRFLSVSVSTISFTIHSLGEAIYDIAIPSSSKRSPPSSISLWGPLIRVR
jgi:hypothetical protein